MREWTNAELAHEPQLAAFFVFAELPKPLEPRNLLFERRWYTLTGDQPIALLVINHAYNEGQITSLQWLELSQAWAQKMIEQSPL